MEKDLCFTHYFKTNVIYNTIDQKVFLLMSNMLFKMVVFWISLLLLISRFFFLFLCDMYIENVNVLLYRTLHEQFIIFRKLNSFHLIK